MPRLSQLISSRLRRPNEIRNKIRKIRRRRTRKKRKKRKIRRRIRRTKRRRRLMLRLLMIHSSQNLKLWTRKISQGHHLVAAAHLIERDIKCFKFKFQISIN